MVFFLNFLDKGYWSIKDFFLKFLPDNDERTVPSSCSPDFPEAWSANSLLFTHSQGNTKYLNLTVSLHKLKLQCFMVGKEGWIFRQWKLQGWNKVNVWCINLVIVYEQSLSPMFILITNSEDECLIQEWDEKTHMSLQVRCWLIVFTLLI